MQGREVNTSLQLRNYGRSDSLVLHQPWSAMHHPMPDGIRLARRKLVQPARGVVQRVVPRCEANVFGAEFLASSVLHLQRAAALADAVGQSVQQYLLIPVPLRVQTEF